MTGRAPEEIPVSTGDEPETRPPSLTYEDVGGLDEVVGGAEGEA